MLIQIDKSKREFEIFYNGPQKDISHRFLYFHSDYVGYKGFLSSEKKLQYVICKLVSDFDLEFLENKTHFFLYDSIFDERSTLIFIESDGTVVSNNSDLPYCSDGVLKFPYTFLDLLSHLDKNNSIVYDSNPVKFMVFRSGCL